MTLACQLGKSILKTRWGCHFKNRSQINWRFASGTSGGSGASSVVVVASPTYGVVVWCGGAIGGGVVLVLVYYDTQLKCL